MPVAVTPPAPPREFRGAWIATVVASIRLALPNPACRSRSKRPNWLRCSTARRSSISTPSSSRSARRATRFTPRRLSRGRNVSPARWAGRREPFYDPLAFAIQEAHKRGLELHAWFNPFRASASAAEIARRAAITLPRRIRNWSADYGDQFWLDPGEPAVREYVLRVVMDVVRRYDVDGVTFDDYFYPYPEKDARDASWIFPTTRAGGNTALRSGLSPRRLAAGKT